MVIFITTLIQIQTFSIILSGLMRYSEGKKNQFENTKISEIRKKTLAALDEVGLVHTIDNLSADEYIEIPPSVEIVPAEFYNARKYMKRGRHLNIPVPRTRRACLEEKKGIMARIRERIKKAKGHYRGYGWRGLNPPRHKLFSLADNIEGLELYAAVNYEIHEGEIEIRDYGQRCFVYVPSRSEMGKLHKVDLITLPTDDSENYYADGVDIEALCDCEDGSFHGRLNYKYKRGEDRFCAHTVAAYFAIAQEKANNGNGRIRQNPFLIPRESLMRFSDKLNNNVIRERRIKGEIKADLLTKTEKEILLWGYVKSHKPEDVFWFDESARLAKHAMSYTIDF